VGVSFASHDRGADGVPLTHVVRIDGAHVVDVVNFKAPILSITEGEGARWALTRNPRAVGTQLPDSFLKRIGAVGDPISVTLPTDSDPVGPVAAVGGAVWVPVRDGVLQFASDTGAYVRHIPLAPAATRVVALVGKGATVTDGVHLQRLDPATGTTTEVLTGIHPFVGLDGRTGWYLVRRDGQVVLGGPDPGRGRTIPQLPAGFAATAFGSSATRTWVTGTVAGAPAIVLLGDDSVRATVVLGNGHAAALAWTDARTVTAVTDGRLFTISVP
jgi:hypothetical protein